MKTIDYITANAKVQEVLKEFSDQPGSPSRKTAIIQNVGFEDLIILYGIMQSCNRQMFLPGEIGNENITIIYTPCPGCTIAIESEPAIDYRWKIHKLPLNLN